jgi:hypothetical protein
MTPEALAGRQRSRDKLTERSTKHHHARRGQSTPEYMAWVSMRGRCGCPTTRHWRNYGGRGITVCERWQHDFAAFLADMGPRPSARHSLDRIDNNGNYEPGNCRWATRPQQNGNRRDSKTYEVDGVRKPITEWAQSFGVSGEVALKRIRRGWSVESAVTLPVGARRRNAWPTGGGL